MPINPDVIGKTYPPFTVRVEAAKIKEFARALRDDNPLHRDEERANASRFGALVAPPTFTRNFWWEGFEVHDDLGFDWDRVLHGQQEFEYHRPLVAGEELTASMRIAETYEKQGGRGGHMTFAVVETTYRDTCGEIVLIGRRTLIETEPQELTPPHASSERRPYRIASADEIDVGDEAQPLVVGPVTRTDFVRYAGASGDFNPIHHDEVHAVRAGNERVFAMGMLPAGYLGRLLEEWFGEDGLRRFRLRFTSRVWPGDVLTCRARIQDKWQEDGTWFVRCSAWVERQDGEEVIRGEANARLP